MVSGTVACIRFLDERITVLCVMLFSVALPAGLHTPPMGKPGES
jgi:hypothetical protein